MTSAISSYKTHGVTKSQVAGMVLNQFTFPEAYKDVLDTYFILHWKSKYFLSQIINGTIVRENDLISDSKEEYLIVYQGCTPAILRKYKNVKLSFRKSKPEFGLQGYVLVRILEEESKYKMEN